ncbi:MAG: peptidylprolyl isomerase [Calditrichaeota bacterium]|nr:peptidylprolyl isomerase [Calditrichota bacterium]
MKNYIFVCLMLIACQPDADLIPEHKVIAQVNDKALSSDRVDDAIPGFTNTVLNDDLKIKFVKNWINQTVLYQEALKNRIELTDAELYQLEQYREQLIVQKYLNNIAKSISVSDKEINDYYILNSGEFKRNHAEIHLSHLYVPNRINTLFKEISESSSLVEIINKYHMDKQPYKILLNGDLGYIQEETINPIILKQISRATLSTIVGPIRIENGYHFIQVIDRKNEGTVYPLSRVKEDIRERLMIQKRAEMEETLINDLSSNYTIINKLTGK